MSDQLVEYACSDHIATITLNRPDKLNAVNDDMVRADRRGAEALRHRQRRAHRHPVRSRPCVFQRRGRAAAAVALARGIRTLRRRAGARCVEPRPAAARGELEAGDGGGAWLRAGPGARPDVGMRPDRRRGGHEIPGDRDAARTVGREILGAAELPRRRRVRHRRQPDRTLLHRRGGARRQRHRTRRTEGRADGDRARIGGGGGEEPATRRAFHDPCAALRSWSSCRARCCCR